MSAANFLDTAKNIGDRLVEKAIWNGETCIWNVVVQERNNDENKASFLDTTDGGVYQGTAGIALFLTELFNYSETEEYKDTAKGALLYAYQKGNEMPGNSFGFHSGRVGIAYALYKYSEITGDKKFEDYCLDILLPLSRNESQDFGLDVISGAGGAIPALLIMADGIGAKGLTDMAVALADNLIAVAKKEIVGWSWEGGYGHSRNLCGYAHGTAGIAHAFLELYNITKNSRYLYAFEQAIEYENQFYNDEEKNWPDLRDSDLSKYISNNRYDLLKEDLLKKKVKEYELKYINAWCHGAPGIALTRIRAYDILSDEFYSKDAYNAMDYAISSIQEYCHADFSLCHGLGGNCEALIIGAETFNDSGLLHEAMTIAEMGIEKFESQDKLWPCVTLGGNNDPSLMLGEAGIGYFYLRLHSAEVPSVLCLNTENKPLIRNASKSNYLKEREEHIDLYFNETIKKLEYFDDQVDTSFTSVTEAYKFFTNLSNYYAGVKKDYFNDLFVIEKTKFEMTLAITDYSAEIKQNLVRPAYEDLDPKEFSFRLPELTKIIERKYDWNNYDTFNSLPDDKEHYIILYKLNNKIEIKQLEFLTGYLLTNLKQKITFEEIVELIKKLFDDSTEIGRIETFVHEQLKALYDILFIDFAEKVEVEV